MAQWNLQILCLKSKITLHPKLRSIFSPLKDSSIILQTAQLFNMEVPEKLSVDEKLYPHLSLIIWATIDFETRNIKFYNEFNKKKKYENCLNQCRSYTCTYCLSTLRRFVIYLWLATILS